MTISPIREAAESAAVDAAWAQWAALTPRAATGPRPPAWTVVDPEALILASLLLAPRERRLEDLVAAWARDAGFLMSKPRFKSVAALFPDEAEARLADFAFYALEGGDSRWRSWASSSAPDPPPREMPLGPLRLREGPALVLRLRAGFGVSAKADLLAMLLGLDGEPAGLKAMTAASGFSERMVRTAAEEMALAGLVEEIEGRPSSFFVDPVPWAELLRIRPPESVAGAASIPPWRFWSAIFAFLCDVSRWGAAAEAGEWSDYVASSRARDLYEGHEGRLARAGIRGPIRGTTPPGGAGEAYLKEFEAFVEAVGSMARGRPGDR